MSAPHLFRLLHRDQLKAQVSQFGQDPIEGRLIGYRTLQEGAIIGYLNLKTFRSLSPRLVDLTTDMDLHLLHGSTFSHT